MWDNGVDLLEKLLLTNESLDPHRVRHFAYNENEIVLKVQGDLLQLDLEENSIQDEIVVEIDICVWWWMHEHLVLQLIFWHIFEVIQTEAFVQILFGSIRVTI